MHALPVGYPGPRKTSIELETVVPPTYSTNSRRTHFLIESNQFAEFAEFHKSPEQNLTKSKQNQKRLSEIFPTIGSLNNFLPEQADTSLGAIYSHPESNIFFA